ncbi:cell wall glucanase [Eremomyces bilateralis CBS 781.70]|uniref:chitinase n=1 Tax=Eremomyces bilateralis CBS 781.70 TaxID=1392243 RepID=A0A6G1GAN4_9PEZI|nr:cell wall glucanase [Eremomyces bilateralis CBS 781.70]KAF1815148.1 cell wall glucanase [Eremomyces bilateralis CBS 781.70]
MYSLAFLSLALLSLLPTSLAQTHTNCDPLTRTDCPVHTALGTNATFDFQKHQADDKVWNTTNGKVNFTPDGAQFTIKERLESPTMQSTFYILFGRVSSIVRAAPGQGIISSVVIQAETLDEIDWEWLGSNTTSVQSNYYGKGDESYGGRGGIHDMVDPTADYHNYTTVWTKEKLEWWLDGNIIRTLKYEDAKDGTRFPQTPSTVRIGIWPAGDLQNPDGVREWAGGDVDYSKGPFTMTVRSVYVEDFTSGATYAYGDTSGNWQSIIVTQGESEAAKEIYTPHGVSGRWNALPKTTRIAIIASSLGGLALVLLAMTWCCIRQRRAGKKERIIADAEFAKGENELMDYRRHMQNGGFAMQGGVGHAPPQPVYHLPNNRF